MARTWSKEKGTIEDRSGRAARNLHSITLRLQANSLDVTLHQLHQNKEELAELKWCVLLNIRQRARINWLTSKDQCTTFFAQAMKAQQAINLIMRLMNTSGVQNNSLEIMKIRAVNYFKNLFDSQQRPLPVSNLNISFHGAISPEMAAWMRWYLIEEEVKGIYRAC